MSDRTWTEEDVRALGVRTDLVTACDVALGVGRSTAYELFRRDELPFTAVRVSPSRVVVPMAGVLAFLGIEPAPPDTAGGGAPEPGSTAA